MTKKGAVISIIIWSIVVVLLLAVMIIGSTIGFGRGFGSSFLPKGELHEIYACEENANIFDCVDIDWHSGKVQVIPSQDNLMRLKQTSYYDVSALEYKVLDGKMSIHQKANWGFFIIGFGTRSSNLVLSLPKKQYKEFIIKTTSGKTILNNISATKMQLVLTSGKIEGHNLQTDGLNAKMTSGNIKIDSIKADNLSVKVTSGDVSFDGEFNSINGKTTSGSVQIISKLMPKTLDANITSGKISVKIPDDDGFKLNCKKTSGDLKSDFDLMTAINGDKNDFSYKSGGTEGRQFNAKITSGTFELLKKEQVD